MAKAKETKNVGLYICVECGLRYRDKNWAAKCAAWCKKNRSCSLEIIKHAVPEK